MLPIKNHLRLVGSVLSIATNKTHIICIDNFYNISTFFLENKVIDKTLNLSKTAEPLHHFSKAVAVSNRDSKLGVGFAKTPKAIILSATPEIAPIASLDWQKLEVSKVTFSKEDNFVSTGGEDGRVLLYSADSYSFLIGLPPFPDYIASIVFSDADSLLFASCFNGKAVVFDVEKNRTLLDIECESIIEDALFFDNDTKLFCVTKNGYTIVYDLLSKEKISEFQIQGAWLTICQKLPNPNFAVVGGKNKSMYIMNLYANKIIDSITMENLGLTAMFLDSSILYVGHSDGAIDIIDLDSCKEEMLECLSNDDLIGAIKLIREQNIFLQTLEEYITKIETLWKTKLQEAIDLLAVDKINEAQEVVEPFMKDPKKKEEFDYYWQQKASVASFLDAIEANNLPEAYMLVDKYPYLKETIAFSQIDSKWDKSFEVAKRLLAQNAQINLPKAQELLNPFANVKCKKEAVMMLLRNTSKFLQAEEEYKAKHFEEYFKLCDRFPFLQETLIYKSALLIGEQIMQRINALENQGEYQKAHDVCKLLASMIPFKSVANDKLKSLKLKLEFIQAYSENKLSELFAMAESNYELRSLNECRKIYDDFKTKEKLAFSFASKGKGKEVLDTLKEYLYIECWRDKIASILKLAYLSEFMLNAPGKAGAIEGISWKETFQYYIERYSKDEEIKKIAEEMGLIDVLNSIPFEGNREGYLSAIVADSLLSIDDKPLVQHETSEGKNEK